MSLGVVTDTQDIWGEVWAYRDTTGITGLALRAAFMPFGANIRGIAADVQRSTIDGRSSQATPEPEKPWSQIACDRAGESIRGSVKCFAADKPNIKKR